MAHETKNILVNHIHDQALKQYAGSYVKGRLIDIGCGTKPYRKLLAPYVIEHIGVDQKETMHDKANIDLWGTAYSIPSEDAYFDSALCTAVLEHLEEPLNALKECYRVLKPSGYAIYSIPFIWHLHEEPRDFYRYSKYGIKYLFEKAGFQLVEIRPLSGFWVTFGQLFVYNIYRFNRGPLRWLHVVDVLGLLIQVFSYGLDKIDKSEKWTWMYMVVVQKP
jgi:ubiquinone/menaquinone biosynthesis C-methylase UbiE